MNEEPEAMMVLPPMSDSEHDSLGDKLFLLRALKAEMPMPTEDQSQQAAYWRTLESELPAFIDHLQRWEIPKELRDGRFGVKTWHHPKLLAALDDLAPETRLLALIDEEIFNERVTDWDIKKIPEPIWSGTAEQLERKLLASDFKSEAQRLLNFHTAAGTYLGRLAAKRPDRVEKNRSANSRGWILRAPLPAGPLPAERAA